MIKGQFVMELYLLPGVSITKLKCGKLHSIRYGARFEAEPLYMKGDAEVVAVP